MFEILSENRALNEIVSFAFVSMVDSTVMTFQTVIFLAINHIQSLQVLICVSHFLPTFFHLYLSRPQRQVICKHCKMNKMN